MNVLATALGHYEVRGNPEEADCVIGHSFATVTAAGSVNHALATFIQGYAGGRPIIADRTLANAFPRTEEDVSKAVEGQISNTFGKGVGTWGTLLAAKRFMDQEGLSKPMQVAQAHHIGRVVMQADKLGMDSVVPSGLPHLFEPEGEQWWTRSLGLWVPREVIGSFALKAQKKL